MFAYYNKIVSLLAEEARKATIGMISIGLGYTAVVLNDGRCGLCCTLRDEKQGCMLWKDPVAYEGGNAYPLLQTLTDARCSGIGRTVALALANALNYESAIACGKDKGRLFDDLQLKAGSRLAMVGCFAPVVSQLEAKGVKVMMYDKGKHLGESEAFFNFASSEADAIILTATSFINGTFCDVLDALVPSMAPIAVLGPSTLMIPALYAGTNVKILGGTVPMDVEQVLMAIRHGKGTAELHRYSSKVYACLS
ncbi:MAG: DUF364 domain-containing protein [Spirochaetia bacterium]|jgi:uncharacterized protein (DUF4213/DUF364 family)|nr:DUF364 domain-containing protein [Spirochaetia bacterium]